MLIGAGRYADEFGELVGEVGLVEPLDPVARQHPFRGGADLTLEEPLQRAGADPQRSSTSPTRTKERSCSITEMTSSTVT